MKVKNLVVSMMLSIMLVIVVLLRLLLWPVRKLDKGLRLSGQWIIKKG